MRARRNIATDQLLERFRGAIPPEVKVTVMTGRAFADRLFYDFLAIGLRFGLIIRFRVNLLVGAGHENGSRQRGGSRRTAAPA